MAPSVVVFIDYQNTHMSAHELFCDYGAPIHECVIHPVRLAEEIIAQRAPGGVLQQVRVYRGRPDTRKERLLGIANDRQMSAWIRDPRVVVQRRPLHYPLDFGEPTCTERPREKGIDVSLAIDMVRMAFEKSYEVGIVVTRDTDLVPPVEMIRDLELAHIETAGWDRASRIRVPRVFHHTLSEDVFDRSRDPREYVQPSDLSR